MNIFIKSLSTSIIGILTFFYLIHFALKKRVMKFIHFNLSFFLYFRKIFFIDLNAEEIKIYYDYAYWIITFKCNQKFQKLYIIMKWLNSIEGF